MQPGLNRNKHGFHGKLENGLRRGQAFCGIGGPHTELEPREASIVNTWQAQVTNIFPTTLGMARGQADRPAASTVQIHGLYGELGRQILTLTGDHGHLTAALLAEMQDVRGSASFENSETEFRRPQCCGDAWPSRCCGKLKKRGEAKAGCYPTQDSI